MKPRLRLPVILGLGAVLISATLIVRAGGPLIVGGTFGVEGQPFRWDPAAFPIPYRTDRGGLGQLAKAQADTFTADSFGVWQAVTTATIAFTKAGDLVQDVTGANIMTLLQNPSSDINTTNAIIYDTDGSVTDAILGTGASDDVLGFAGPRAITPAGFITRGRAVLNGKFIDGQPSPTDVSRNKYKEVFVHELGHFCGLDHSQANLEALTIPGPTPPDVQAGLPLMFPFLLSNDPARVDAGLAPLAVDDESAISALYPEATFATSTGRIQGRIFFSDGVAQAQGYNVIARQVDNPGTPEDESKRIVVSSVSGFLFTACAGNPVTPAPFNDCGPDITDFGSRDPTLIGFYDIPGLPPNSYTVEVEAIDPLFTLGSRVGPIGDLDFQFPLPQGSTAEFYSNPETGTAATDNPSASFPLTVSVGGTQVDIDIFLNDTQPSFDAWESATLRLLRQFWARADRQRPEAGL